MMPLFTGPAITSTGRYILRLQMVLEKVALDMEHAIMHLSRGLHILTQEVNQHHTFSLQNHLAFDYLLASQGGVCVLIGAFCCLYVNDSSEEI